MRGHMKRLLAIAICALTLRQCQGGGRRAVKAKGEEDGDIELGIRLPPPVEWTTACLKEVTPSGREEDALDWERDLCTRRYVWVFGFEYTGTGAVRMAVSESPYVLDPIPEQYNQREAQYAQEVFPTTPERRHNPPGCGYIDWHPKDCCYSCPYLNHTAITHEQRQSLHQDWVTKWGVGAEQTVVLKDPDFLVAYKLWLFPYVSHGVVVIRFPLCMRQDPEEWAAQWLSLLRSELEGLPGNVIVVRMEDLLLHLEEMTKLLEEHLVLNNSDGAVGGRRLLGGKGGGEFVWEEDEEEEQEEEEGYGGRRGGGGGGALLRGRRLHFRGGEIKLEYLCHHKNGQGEASADETHDWTPAEEGLLEAFEYPRTFEGLDEFAALFQTPRVWTKDQLLEIGRREWAQNARLPGPGQR